MARAGGDDLTARAMRGRVVDWLEANQDTLVDDGGSGLPATFDSFMVPDRPTYLASLRRHGGGRSAWGDNLCVRAAAGIFDARIVVYTTLSDTPVVVNPPAHVAAAAAAAAAEPPVLYLGHFAEYRKFDSNAFRLA